MNNRTKAPFPWLGGKGNPKIKAAILEALPPRTRYIEPFGGGASILIAKEQSEVEVYNDVNRGIVNFFRVIADVDYFAKFLARVTMLPCSRELYEEYLRTWSGVHDPVEQAVRWYYVIQQSFSAIFGNSWGVSVNTRIEACQPLRHAGEQALRTFRKYMIVFKKFKLNAPTGAMF